MTISLFIRNKEFQVSTEGFNDIYKVNESRELADNIPVFLKDFISKIAISNIEKVIYSAGPASFTTIRIINSVLKGLLVSYPNVKFVGVSNFLTYMAISSKISADGIIAIPTMRGDYFTCEYSNKKILTTGLLDTQSIEKYKTSIFFDNDNIYDDINLSKLQKSILNSDFNIENSNYIKNSLEIDYGFTPEYKY